MRVALISWLLFCTILSQAYSDSAPFTAHCNYKQPKTNQSIASNDFHSIKNMLRLHRTHTKQKKQIKKTSSYAEASADTSAHRSANKVPYKLEHALINNNDTYNRQERLNALHQTRSTGGQRTKRIIAVDAKIYTYAREYEIPEAAFAQRTMNEYEYQLHKEFIEQLTQAQQLKPWYNQAREHAVFLDIVGHSVAFGMEANQNNHEATATYWCDIAWQSLDLASAVGEGIALGVYNTAAFVGSAIRHPVETIQAVGHGVASVVTMLAQATGTILKWQALEERGYGEQLDAELDALVDQMDSVINHCSEQLVHMPLREKVKHITAFGTELIIPGKAFKVIHNVCSRMKPLAIGLLHALRDEQKAVQVAARVEGIAGNVGLRIVEGAQEVAGAAKIVLSEAQLLLHNFHMDLMKKLAPEIAAVRVLFDNRVKGFGEFSNKYLKIAYEHILGFELNFSRRGVPSISGLHHDFMNFIEQRGLLKFSNKVIHNSGFYSADIIVEGKSFQKTFFPANWSQEKVINAIYEAYNDFAQRGYHYTLMPDGKYLLKGTIKEGIEIEMYVTKNGKIVTAYPRL